MNKLQNSMLNKTIVLLLSLFLFPVAMLAQITISGYVEDMKLGESLIGVNVVDRAMSTGVTSNAYGFFSIKVSRGDVNLEFSYLGYKTKYLSLHLEKDTVCTVKLEEDSFHVREAVVSSVKKKNQVTQMSMERVPVSKLSQIPVIFGESDILKVIQLLPGVQGGTEGSSGMFVRGGAEDQNLFLLDDVPVYNCSHLFGFFSVFNPSMVKSVDLYKGGFPARYGGRLSSVVDVRTNDGNFNKIKGEFSIGAIASSFELDGPIKKGKTSFLISGRRTYLDILAAPFIKASNNNSDEDVKSGYFFYDLNAKLTHKLSNLDKIYLSAYLGRDKMYYNDNEKYTTATYSSRDEDNMNIHWGNVVSSLRWNHIFSESMFANTTLTYSNYRFVTDYFSSTTQQGNSTSYSQNYYSSIRDFSGKMDFYYYPSSIHSIRFGAGYTRHMFKPGVSYEKSVDQSSNESYSSRTPKNNIGVNEMSAYIEDDIKFTPSTNVNLGLRYSGIYVQNKMYKNLQPRVSLKQKISDDLSLKASYSKMVQYVHLLSSSAILSMPTDLWVPVTKRLSPSISHQFALGMDMALTKDYSLNVEGYYKKMQNLIEYKEGANFMSTISNTWDDKVVLGEGQSYGIEFKLEKQAGNTTGWISYTLSKSDRTFDDLNFGKTFPASNDRRHNINIVVTHKFSEKFDIGATWVYNSGKHITLQSYEYPSYEGNDYYGEVVKETGGKNSYKMGDYHRLDLSANFHKKKKHGVRTWNISIYNVYNRMNPFILSWDEKYTDTNESYLQLEQFSLFSIIPTVTYSFKF